MKISLKRVHYMPRELEPGVLYVSEEYGAAAHLCACGCGSKIRTPLGATEWELDETPLGPTLRPSIGNWQQPCRSHYWICKGEVIWAGSWTPEEIELGRHAEEARRKVYYEALESRSGSWLRKLWAWLRNLLIR